MSAKQLPLSCTDRVWELTVYTIVYVGWFLHPMFLISPVLLYWLSQPRRSASEEGDNVTATHDPRPGILLCIYVAAAALRCVSNL